MKQVTILIAECEVNINSVAATLEILQEADRYWEQTGHSPLLNIQIAGLVEELSLHASSFSIRPVGLASVGHSDLMIVPSINGRYLEAVEDNRALIDWISQQYKNGTEIACMCSGAFLLAASGLLDGRTCSIHWNDRIQFMQMYPKVLVAEDRIITDKNGIYTSGGAYSFLNLLLYLVEKLFDRTTAIYCSKIFQIDMERTTQSPFTIFHVQKAHGDPLIDRAQAYIEANLDERISIEELARELAISRRSFDRRFFRATGNTPLEYLQRVKVEGARKELEKGRKSIFEIMSESGYSDEKAFRQVFKKITGLSPLEYRKKYARVVDIN